MKNRDLFLIFCLALLLCLLPTFAVADGDPAPAQYCGDDLAWSFDEATGVLTITGSGAMDDFLSYPVPWKAYQSQITQVDLPGGLTRIGYGAFQLCSKLNSIVIPDSVSSIGGHAFDYTGYWDQQPDGLVYLGSALVGNKGTIDQSTVSILEGTKIVADYALYNCNTLAVIHLPDSVVHIGISAFQNCTGMVSINIPSKVHNISRSTFRGCTGLTNFVIPENVYSIDDYAFYGCKRLTDLVISNNVTSIGDIAFYNCAKLTNVTLPCSAVFSTAFSGCTAVSNVHLTKGTGTWENSQGPWYYSESEALTISLEHGITAIADYAFENCAKIPNLTVDIPDSVTVIGNGAFYKCAGLTSINIPASVTTIGGSAFRECFGLTTITIPDSVISIGQSAFYGCTGLTDFSIPDSLTKISEGTFLGCTNLKTVTIPDSIKSIGDSSFSNCSALTDVYFQGASWQRMPIGRWGNEPLENATWHYLPIIAICMERLPDKLTYGHGEDLDLTGADVRLECENGSIGYLAFTAENFTGYDATSIGKQTITVTYEGLTTMFDVTVEHIPGELVRENVTPAACTAGGKYDEVQRCTYCGEELYRHTFTISDPLGHSLGEPEQVDAVPATCTTAGSYTEVIHCVVCGEEISCKEVTVDALGHTHSAPVKENVVAASGTKQGSYDEVVYCSVCGEEISRETKYTSKTSKGMTLSQEPQDATIRNKQKATFTVKVSGSKLTYQWYYRKNASAAWKKVSGGTKAKLSVAGTTSNSGYQYYCVIKNGKGTLKSDVATLTVELFPPEISVQPESQTVHVGDKATFAVSAEGDGLTYQWYYKKSASATKWAKVSKATKATYSVKGTIANDGYQYRCLIKNADGKQYTDPVTLDVDYHLPEITAQPTIPKSVKKNTSVTLTVEAENIYDAALTFQWYYRKSSSAKWTKIKKATTATYTFKATAKLNGYQYKCDVTNVDGTVSTKTLKLKVK